MAIMLGLIVAMVDIVLDSFAAANCEAMACDARCNVNGM
jgi:hypothetical protein